MIYRMLQGCLLGLLAGLLVACSDGNPAPAGDPPILNDFDALPKQLATIELTITPTPVIAGEQPAMATAVVTPVPLRPTATMTPYVGIFLGEPTSENNEPAPTLAPYVINTGGGGLAVAEESGCSVPVATTLNNVYSAHASVAQQLGCPITSGSVIYGMALQPFERGNMFWRSDTRQIYALANSGPFWQVADGWNESMPADDPALAPPGGFIQPVRGFGLAWRSSQPIRDALGWGTLPETQYDAFWQDFEHGALFVGDHQIIYALYTAAGQHSGPLFP